MLLDTSHRDKIELFFRCKNVWSKSFLDKSDPYILVDMSMHGSMQTVGRTESVKDDPNPIFKRTVCVPYVWDAVQDMTFTLYNEGGERDEIIGMGKVKLAEILDAKEGKMMNITLPSMKTQTTLEIYWQGARFSQKNYKVAVHLDGIRDKSKFVNNGTFLRFSRPCRDFEKETDLTKIPDWVISHETEHKEDINGVFDAFQVNAACLCREIDDAFIKVDLMDWSTTGDHLYVASAYFTIAEYRKDKYCIPFKDKTGAAIGDLIIDSVKEEFDYDFADYEKAGLKLDLTVAVDFTASNGPAKSPLSLHYISKSRPMWNDYQVACTRVGDLFFEYAKDKKIAGYGFGAKINGDYPTCFPLSFDESNHKFNSVDDLMAGYTNAIHRVEFFGPSNFAPLIRLFQQSSRRSYRESHWNYSVLLLLTDGQCMDFNETKEAIVDCCNDPLSIIIMGIGNEDFSNMKELDGDKRRLQGATRDLVQFIKFRDHANDHVQLTRAVVSELPTQIDQFYQYMRIKPY